jgi:tRNA threonylcarbamoyladenosine biosynthesis protein TsaB
VKLLAFDTATAATVVALDAGTGEVIEARHLPPPGEHPGHATELLPMVTQVCAASDVLLDEIDRFVVGIGPGSFTGLRIGVSTARGLAQAAGAELVGVSSLAVLADGAAHAAAGAPVVAAIDARRGELFAAVWRGTQELLAPVAIAPEALAAWVAEHAPKALTVGDGALRFRDQLEPAGAAIPPDADPLHGIAGRSLCRLGAEAQPAPRDAVLPDYLRRPDATPRAEREQR